MARNTTDESKTMTSQADLEATYYDLSDEHIDLVDELELVRATPNPNREGGFLYEADKAWKQNHRDGLTVEGALCGFTITQKDVDRIREKVETLRALKAQHA